MAINTDASAPTASGGTGVQRLLSPKEAGEPIVLAINGASTLVVQDAVSYRMLLELVDRLETLEGIRAGLDDMEAGRTVSLDQVKEEFAGENGVPG